MEIHSKELSDEMKGIHLDIESILKKAKESNMVNNKLNDICKGRKEKDILYRQRIYEKLVG